MTTKWLCTTAILLTFGGGIAMAQSPSDSQKNREHQRSASPREPGRSAAGEEHLGGASKASKPGEARSSEREGAREPHTAAGNEPNSNAKTHDQQRSERQPDQKTEKMGRSEHQPPTTTGQNEDRGRSAREAEQRGQNRQGASDREQDKSKQSERQHKDQNQRAAQSPQNPNERQNAKERVGQESGRNQAAQPQKDGNSQANQTTRPGDNERQRQTVGQTQDRSGKTGQPSAMSANQDQRTSANRDQRASINQDQRKQVVDRLRNEKEFARENQNINIRLNVGERLPDNVRPRRLPADIVEIVPQYRDYDYTVIDDRVAVIDPRTRDIVDVIDEGGGGYASQGYSQGYSGGSSRITLSSDERQQLLKRAPTTVGSAGGNSCITLQQVPEELARQHPELASDRYIAIGDQIVVVDPNQHKVVQVID